MVIGVLCRGVVVLLNRTDTCTYVCTYMHTVCMCMYVRIYIRTCMCMYIRTYIHACTVSLTRCTYSHLLNCSSKKVTVNQGVKTKGLVLTGMVVST